MKLIIYPTFRNDWVMKLESWEIQPLEDEKKENPKNNIT